MALVLKDRVKQTASNPGTGTITLLTTTAGFQSFSAVGDGNTTYFAIVDAASGAWEVNYGTYTASGTTLTRNATPLSSSAGGALVNFTGSVDVFVTYPSSRSAYQNEAGTQVVQTAFGAITATSAALTTGTISTLPTSNTDIVNKQYADAIASGIHFHEAVALATTTALPANTYNNGTSGVGATLTANANGALSVDSTLTVVSERVLIKNEVAGANNGVYVVTQVGSAGTPYILTRATDFDTVGTGVDQIDEGDFFLVTSGTANANTAWVQQTAPPITVGTTAIVFQQFSAPITYTAGTGLNESPAYTFNIANTTVSANTYGSASAVPVFAVNAQGQLTSVTNTNIAISGSAVSGAISGQAGSVANALTLGTYLTGTSFNGSSAVTATVDATSANTASKVVARDASGDFSAGTITATLTGNATNVSGTVAIINGGTGETTRQAAMDALAGGTTSGQYLRGNGSDVVMSTIQVADVPTLNQSTTGNATTATTATNLAGGSAGTVPYQSAAGTTVQLAAGTSGQVLSSNGAAAPSWLTSTNANTASAIVQRDASGNFSAGTITAALTGNVTGNVTGSSGSTTGNAATATTLQTARTINGTSFNGSANITITANTTNTLTLGTYLTGTSFNGSAAVTAAVDATTTNTASKVVARDASGNFAAGTITASLTGNASGSAATFTSTSQNSQFNSIGVGTAGSGTAGEIRATNSVTAHYSDDRLKTKLGNIEGALAKVKTLSGFYYEANETAQALGYKPKREVGVSAQSVQAVLPEVVVPAPIDEQYLTVHYDKLVPLLIEAIKELEAKVAALEAKG
jgi:hypothetical protein